MSATFFILEKNSSSSLQAYPFKLIQGYQGTTLDTINTLTRQMRLTHVSSTWKI